MAGPVALLLTYSRHIQAYFQKGGLHKGGRLGYLYEPTQLLLATWHTFQIRVFHIIIPRLKLILMQSSINEKNGLIVITCRVL